METIIDYRGHRIQMDFNSVLEMASKTIKPTGNYTYFGRIPKLGIPKEIGECPKCKLTAYAMIDVCKCWRAIE